MALITASTMIMAAPAQASAQVVRPTSTTVPANLLRFSIVFNAPPEDPVLPRIALRLADGQVVREPFLDQELWSPDGRILTVLMHPGRVKKGLIAHRTLGRALKEGERVTVTFDGRPLRTWRVTGPDDEPPEPSEWRASSPTAGTMAPLLVRLNEPVDAFDADLIAVRAGDGRRVEGKADLEEGERTWRFLPDAPWTTGAYTVVAAPTLEDPAGNRPGVLFEHVPGSDDVLTRGPSFDVRPGQRQQIPPLTGSRRRAHTGG